MSKQIAVRLPDALVDKIDALVREGILTSRAAVVTSALEREFRRRLAARDAEIYAATESQGDPDDLNGLSRWAARQQPDLD